jgi:hypothetical protein
MGVVIGLAQLGCFALGGILLLLPRRAQAIATRLIALALIVGGLGMLLAEGVDVPLPLPWLHEQEPAALVVTGPAHYMVAGILAWAAVGLWQHNDLSPPVRSGYGPGLMLVTSALTIFAVTIDHFLLRYVALELVALVTAVCLAVALPAYRGPALLWRAYLPWRLGGGALLLAILVMERGTGALNIVAALSGALHMAPATRLVAGAGAAVAAWIKLGLPPFHGWLIDGARASRVWWSLGNVLPLLGAYLLYRFQYVLAAPGVWLGITVLAGAPIAVGLADAPRIAGRARVDVWAMAREWWPVWHGALAFPAVGLGLGPWYLATFLPARLALATWASRRDAEPATEPTIGRERPVAAMPAWLRMAVATAARLDGGLDALVTTHLARLVVHGVAPAMHDLEQRLDALLHGVVHGVAVVSTRLQRWHTGRLRTNLLWTLIALGGVVLAALMAWGY